MNQTASSPADRTAWGSAIFLAGLILLAGVWLASQGGLAAVAFGKYVAVFFILLESLHVLAALWLGAAGLGWPIRRWIVPQARDGLLVQLGAGLAMLMLANFLLAWADAVTRVTAWSLPLLGIGLLVWQVVETRRSLRATDAAPSTPSREGESERSEGTRRLTPWMLLLGAAPLAVLLTACAMPPGTVWRVEAFAYDVLSYHLQLPREWLAAGGWRGFEHHVYSFFPSLAELTYLQIGAMFGGFDTPAIYTTQLFHASTAVFAACMIGALARRLAGPAVGVATGALFLAVPWVTILGSLAYNEMYTLAFGATALALALDPVVVRSLRTAALIGVLVGAATLVKLTAGPQLAVPLGLILLLKLGPADELGSATWRRAVALAAVAALAGTLTLAPYFIRNAAVTGNPVFPFATELFGTAHWDQALAERWAQGHHTDMAWGERLEAWVVHWWGNAGYGALGGSERVRSGRQFEAVNVAHFTHERGFPLLWLSVAIGAGAMLFRGRGWGRIALALLLMLAVQTGFWFTSSHLQSRFLVATLLPGLLLLAGGLGGLRDGLPRQAWLAPAATALLVVAATVANYAVFFQQQRTYPDEAGQWHPMPPAFMIDTLRRPVDLPEKIGRLSPPGDLLVNHLPPESKVLVIADNSRLLYIRTSMIYESAFDRSHLGILIRRHNGNPQAVNQALKEMGITHVWLHWGELDRLHGTYGYDPAVTRAMLQRLMQAGWEEVTAQVLRRVGDPEYWQAQFQRMRGIESLYRLK